MPLRAPDPETVTSLRARLLRFFDREARDLPWRHTDDPYAVWVSEVMLQQTRVETVVPYFRRWMERFPDVESLAAAEQGDVLKMWEGLGYYRRARNLHRGARLVRERFAGAVPADPGRLREVPGIGEYTAGAVASIAFGRPVPAVDGNVRRVLSRLFDLESPAASELRALAGALVDPERPGDFNQAVMELGATVCTPRSPSCEACPVARSCRARALGVQEERPVPPRKRPVPEVEVGVAVVTTPGPGSAADPSWRVLLRRRPEEGMLGGLWEFPGAELRDGESPGEAARRAAGPLELEPETSGRPLTPVPHVYSHLRATYHPFLFPMSRSRRAPGADWIAADRRELAELALPMAQRTIARELLQVEDPEGRRGLPGATPF